MSLIVTCVHGTWARGSRWPRLEHTIADALAGCGPVAFHYFEWSGRNSVKARARAAAGLRDSLLRDIAGASDARHLLVAHSHGANIVLHALADADDEGARIRSSLEGIVLLSPPLLDCEIVDQPAAAANRLLLGAIAAIPLLVVAASNARAALGLGRVTGLAGLAVLIGIWLALFRPGAVRRRAEALSRQLALPRLDFPGLVVRAPRDEPILALSSVSAFARVARFVWTRVLRIDPPIDRAAGGRLHDARGWRELGRAVFDALVLLPMSVSFASRAHDAAAVGHWLTATTIVPIATMLVTAAVVIVGGSLVLLVLLPAFSILLWPFGIAPRAAAALLTVSVKRVPTAAWTVAICRTSGLFRWRHNVYEQPAALEHVCSYVGHVGGNGDGADGGHGLTTGERR